MADRSDDMERLSRIDRILLAASVAALSTRSVT
jgi:hypothetical protein